METLTCDRHKVTHIRYTYTFTYIWKEAILPIPIQIVSSYKPNTDTKLKLRIETNIQPILIPIIGIGYMGIHQILNNHQ